MSLPIAAAPLALRWSKTTVPLVEGPGVVVGRSPGADVVIESATVSRHHAWFRIEGPRTLVEDLSSTHGVYVNGTKIDEPTALWLGDRVALGEVVLAVVRRPPAGATARARKASGPARQPTARPGVTAGVHDLFASFARATREALRDDRLHDAVLSASHLHDSLLAKRAAPLGPATVADAVHLFAAMAHASEQPEWLDRVFEVLAVHQHPIGVAQMHHLAALAAEIGVPPDATRHRYLAWLRSQDVPDSAHQAITTLAHAGSR